MIITFLFSCDFWVLQGRPSLSDSLKAAPCCLIQKFRYSASQLVNLLACAGAAIDFNGAASHIHSLADHSVWCFNSVLFRQAFVALVALHFSVLLCDRRLTPLPPGPFVCTG